MVIALALQITADTFSKRTDKPYVPLSCNLNDAESIREAIDKIGRPRITHVFWYAEANRPHHIPVRAFRGMLAIADMLAPGVQAAIRYSPQKMKDLLFGGCANLAGSGRNEKNQLWMGNVLDVLKANHPGALRSFMLGTGGKHYGMHLGPTLFEAYQCPFEEDVHRAPGPLSYFDAEDFIFKRSEVDGFTWNVVRPTFIIGICPELTLATQSFGVALATYASLLKASGQSKLIYPGSWKSFTSKIHLVTSEKIAEVAVFGVMNHPNEAYNCVSTPPFSWEESWDDVANYFGLEGVAPKEESFVGICVSDLIGKQPKETWELVQKKYELHPHDFNCLLNCDFLDKAFTSTFDSTYSVEKLRKHGFPEERIFEYSSGVACLIAFFNRLVEEKIIPNPQQQRE